MKIDWGKEIKFLNKDYKIYRLIVIGIIYLCFISLIICIAKFLIEYPVFIAYKYNITLNGEEYVNLFNSYKWMFLGVMLIAICTVPIIKLANRLKKASKDGAEFYSNEEEQNTTNISTTKSEVLNDAVMDLMESNDDQSCDEKIEEEMYNTLMEDKDNQLNLLKCKNIKSHMKPLTMLVTRELYCNSKNNITFEIALNYVKNISKRNKSKQEEKSKKITKNIIDFLKNNDIIEADDVEEEKYYFTSLGNIFMNYFSSGII